MHKFLLTFISCVSQLMLGPASCVYYRLHSGVLCIMMYALDFSQAAPEGAEMMSHQLPRLTLTKIITVIA